jgi:hypothetical protein
VIVGNGNLLVIIFDEVAIHIIVVFPIAGCAIYKTLATLSSILHGLELVALVAVGQL